MSDVVSIDPRTGQVTEVVAQETSREEVEQVCDLAATAAPALESLGRAGRARLLRELADALEERRDDIVAVADRETALGTARLNGELNRTAYQLRLFAEVLEEGSYLEVAIDHQGDTPMGPRPDLRRMLVPIGPVDGFRGQQLPPGVLRPGRGHRVSAGRGLPGGGQGAPLPPPHLAAVLRGDGRGSAAPGRP